MRINKFLLIGLFLLVAAALSTLLVIQFRIMNQDIEANHSVVAFSIPAILSDLFDNMMYNRDLGDLTNEYQGTASFQFTRDSEPTDPIQAILKKGLDEVIALNYPDLDYSVDGFISSEYGCMVHGGHKRGMPKARMITDADNHMCFCTVFSNTLDISMNYTNMKATAINQSAEMLFISIAIIIFIIAAFWYTLQIIRKQKKLSDLKRDFVNNLTHEFKTPIFSISLAATSIKNHTKTFHDDKLHKFANLISSESRRLQAQVDKILQIALLDSGNLTLEKKEIDLHVAIQHAVAGFSMIIEERKGKVELNLNASNHIVSADETHLNNILFNLIDNAQKYSQGPPIIKLETRDTGKGILLIVKDHGIGMDSVTQKYVFDQFYRSQGGDVHDVKGFGLGLSYVKRMVEHHKGNISLKSEMGKGSEFSITLPTS